MTTPTAAPEPGQPQAAGFRPSALTSAGLTATAIAFVSVLVWLFGPTPAEPEAPIDLAALASVDGVFAEVDPPKLVLRPYRPLDGRTEVTFQIRDAERGNFDVAHLRSHASIGLPSRIYYEKRGDTYYAIYKEDAPANSAQGAQP